MKEECLAHTVPFNTTIIHVSFNQISPPPPKTALAFPLYFGAPDLRSCTSVSWSGWKRDFTHTPLKSPFSGLFTAIQAHRCTHQNAQTITHQACKRLRDLCFEPVTMNVLTLIWLDPDLVNVFTHLFFNFKWSISWV